jgi:hypothetical protein
MSAKHNRAFRVEDSMWLDEDLRVVVADRCERVKRCVWKSKDDFSFSAFQRLKVFGEFPESGNVWWKFALVLVKISKCTCRSTR